MDYVSGLRDEEARKAEDEEKKDDVAVRSSHRCDSLTGLHYSGLTLPWIRKRLEQLPNATRCQGYTFLTPSCLLPESNETDQHRAPIDNPSGCARCESYSRDNKRVKYLYGRPSADFLALIEKEKEETAQMVTTLSTSLSSLSLSLSLVSQHTYYITTHIASHNTHTHTHTHTYYHTHILIHTHLSHTHTITLQGSVNRPPGFLPQMVSVTMEYNKMKSKLGRLRVFRSKIHNWGVFSLEPLKATY